MRFASKRINELPRICPFSITSVEFSGGEPDNGSMPDREEMRVPRWYSAGVHFLGTTGASLPLVGYGVYRLIGVNPDGSLIEWIFWVLVFLLIASAVEYSAHRWILHRRRPGLEHAFVEHTLRHHRWFDAGDLEARSGRDYHQILFPVWGVVLIQYGLNLPLCLVLSGLAGGWIGALGLCVGSGFFFLYESVHAICHFPETHPVFKLGIFRALREHHRRHHDPALMGRRNFNIVVPVWDFLLGTRA